MMGLNPFDMISGEMARQIVTGTRQQGFSGRQAEGVQNAVVGTVNDLGTSIDSTIQLYTDAIRRNGQTIDEARERFEKFDDAANQLSKSVQDYTDQFIKQSQALTAARRRYSSTRSCIKR
jgi:archaellum component FlaC